MYIYIYIYMCVCLLSMPVLLTETEFLDPGRKADTDSAQDIVKPSGM